MDRWINHIFGWSIYWQTGCRTMSHFSFVLWANCKSGSHLSILSTSQWSQWCESRVDFVARITKYESSITESDKHFVLFNIWPTFAEHYRQYNNIGMMSQWGGFRYFIDETFAELMRFVSRFADHAAAVTANHHHLPPQRASGLRLRFPSLIYGCSCVHPPRRLAFLPCLTLPCLWSGK